MIDASPLSWPWKADPFAAAMLLCSAALYYSGSWHTWRRSTGRHRAQQRRAIGAFTIGWLILAVALLSPLAVISESLFSWHMTQHELLMLVCAPLIALGRPLAPVVSALPGRWRPSLARSLASRQVVAFTSPLAVFLLHALLLWLWHVPVLFEAAVRDDRIHLIQHVSFAGSACLFWWTMLQGRYGRTGYGVAVFYVFATALHSGSLGALAAFSERPWYQQYVESAGHSHDPLLDQQLAGLIMWIPSGVTMMLFGLGIFAAWLGHAEYRRQHGWSSGSWRKS